MNAAQESSAADPAEIVTGLYGLLPAEFTAARNARSAEAARRGERELGKRLKALPKPSAAAWLANLLVREREEAITDVLTLGASLREAQQDLDREELRRLNAERHRMLRSLAREARELADEVGNPVSTAVAAEVEQTLWAAMTDADAAAALATGRLVRSLEANGWEPVDLDGAVAEPDTASPLVTAGTRTKEGRRSPAAPGKTKDSEPSRQQQAGRAKALAAAEQELAAARDSAGQAESRLASVLADLEEQTAARDRLTDEIDELKEQIRELERSVNTVDRRRGTLERSRDAARREARAARRAVEKAETRLDSLR
ncbi:hypothetical protein H9639_15050 [Arthrobacter sp. Sa2CUA1]|uniref:Transposase n=1 Tax=Arthrobacter gallicola TaxID=2762225 RepID=A0ABR8UVR9_9MICC|nr:hypothetical protein [Arthrobacter gallicola]MBD7996614.1 hypothetical protein [Arthrobacter gallicola]